MEQPQQPATQPESNLEVETVTIAKKDLEFLQQMVKDTAYLSHHVQSLVLTLVDSLPEKAKKADRIPNGFEIASMIPGLMKTMQTPIAEMIRHFPELKRICEQYSQLHQG